MSKNELHCLTHFGFPNLSSAPRQGAGCCKIWRGRSFPEVCMKRFIQKNHKLPICCLLKIYMSFWTLQVHCIGIGTRKERVLIVENSEFLLSFPFSDLSDCPCLVQQCIHLLASAFKWQESVCCLIDFSLILKNKKSVLSGNLWKWEGLISIHCFSIVMF